MLSAKVEILRNLINTQLWPSSSNYSNRRGPENHTMLSAR
jgi:hypothetical protein